MNREIQWRQLPYVKNEIIGQYEHRTRGKTHFADEYAYKCSVCETNSRRLRWDEDSGCICCDCYVNADFCSCGKIAVEYGLCRECYAAPDDEYSLEDFVWRKAESTKPESPCMIGEEFRSTLRKKMNELGYNRVEKQLDRVRTNHERNAERD
jgi:hypothetical protein